MKMKNSSVSAYQSNPWNLQAFTGLELKGLALWVIVGLSLLAAGKAAAQTAPKVEPIMHAMDSFNIGEGRSLKLYVASTTGDPKTFNRIFGFLFDPLATKAEKQKRPVEVSQFFADTNKIVIAFLDEKNGAQLVPSPNIERYLRGKGSVPMAPESNITIIPKR